MRVISGSAKGTPLKAAAGRSTRPILDRVKVALFDILRPHIEGARVLDAFAGTGAVGIEALSQGADSCIFLDASAQAVATIKDNLGRTHLTTKAQVRHTDAFQFMRATQKTFDIIFFDPPQFKNLWVEAIHTLAERPTLLAPSGLVVVKIDPTELETLSMTTLQLSDERRYGRSVLLFFERSEY